MTGFHIETEAKCTIIDSSKEHLHDLIEKIMATSESDGASSDNIQAWQMFDEKIDRITQGAFAMGIDQERQNFKFYNRPILPLIITKDHLDLVKEQPKRQPYSKT